MIYMDNITRFPSKKDTTILVVGGAGYIGGYVEDRLTSRCGYNVLVYDNLLFEDRYLKSNGENFIHGDIRDKEKLKRVIDDRKPAYIIWLAAIVGDGACQINQSLTKDLNEDSVKWLTDLNLNCKIIFTSTCSVYGANHKKNLAETEIPNPLSLYAETKLNAEQYLLKNHSNSVAFRLGTLYGIGDEFSRLRFDLVANVLTMKACLNENITVFGGEQWRPMLHVRDVAEAVIFAIQNDLTGLYNLTDTNYQITDLAEYILDQLKGISTSKIAYTNMNFEDMRNYHVSNAKLMATGWKPQWKLEHGIHQIMDVVLQKRVKNPKDAIYSNEHYLKYLENYGK